MEPSDEIRLYGLVGYPLGHSFSRDFFTKKFTTEGIRAEYRNFEIPSTALLSDIRHLKASGLNVTSPYKQDIIPLLDEINPTARDIGAVNVIKFCGTRLIGYNTDVVGFRESLVPWLRHNSSDAGLSALVLGSGGASKAVCHALAELGIRATVVSRNPSSASMIAYDDLTEKVITESRIIVNATPLGMGPNIGKCPPVPFHFLTERHLCYDLIYNPAETEFLTQAKKHGAQTKNGHEMLVLQALASWRIWNA